MRGCLGRLLLVVLGCLAGLAACELVLRVTGYEGDRERVHAVFDPSYGTVRRDSWIFEFEIPRGADEVVLRGQRIPRRKDPRETRILFVGDSGTEGAYVPLERTFPLQLQAILERERPDLHVRAINAGVYGMTTLDELHFLRERLLPLRPDVVVLGLFMSNDINFNLGHREYRRDPNAARSWIRRLRGSSALVHFLYGRAIALGARHRGLREGGRPGDGWIPVEATLVDEHGFHMLNYPEGEVATYMKDSSSLIDHAFEVLEEAFRQFQALGRRHGFRFVVVLIPAPSAVAGTLRLLHFDDVWADLERWGLDVAPVDLDVDLPTRRVRAICERLDLTCIDPTGRMRRAGLRVFFPKDEHLTPLGHAIVARTLADTLPPLESR